MGEKIDKKKLIEECINGVEDNAIDYYGLTDDEYDQFHEEVEKIVPEFIKSYKYDVDMFGNECIEDYSYFQKDLMSEIQRRTSFFKEME